MSFVKKIIKSTSSADPKAYTATLQKGLYLVSQCLFNPYTDERFYLIKAGKASHMSERMNQYNTYNPMMYHIDYHYVRADADNKVKLLEEFCHNQLRHVAIKNEEIRAREWFEVSRETYLEICEKGFAWFGL